MGLEERRRLKEEVRDRSGEEGEGEGEGEEEEEKIKGGKSNRKEGMIKNFTKTMKKLLLIIGMLAVAATGCARTNNNDKRKEKKVENTQKTTTMKTIALTKADFLKRVDDYEKNPTEWKYLGDKPALVDFYASWCGPCKALAPVLEELAAEYGDQIYIYKVNTEEEQELAAAFGIRSIPTLLFIPMEGKPQMAQGALPKAMLKKAIDDVMLGK